MKKSRRVLSAEFKAMVALDGVKDVITISALAQIYSIHPNLIFIWKKKLLNNVDKVFHSGKNENEQIGKILKENEDLVHQHGQLTAYINWKKGVIILAAAAVGNWLSSMKDLEVFIISYIF